MPDKIWYLRRLNLFDEMSDDEVEQISRKLHMWRCDARHSCLDQASDRIYLLKAGRVRLYQLTADGHELTTAIVVPGQMFGIGALVGGTTATHTESLEESVVCEAAAAEFMALMARHPLLMAKVLVSMARHIVTLEQSLERIAYKSVPTRLADLLLSLVPDAEEASDGTALPRYSQEELAKMIGATREAVARALGDWRHQDLVTTDGGIVLRDVEGLRRVAASDSSPRTEAPRSEC